MIKILNWLSLKPKKKKILKWLYNTDDPNLATPDDPIIGEPMQTESCTVEQLKQWMSVGVYVEVETETETNIKSIILKPIFFKYENKNECNKLIWNLKAQADNK